MNGRGISKSSRESRKRRWISIPPCATPICKSVLRRFGSKRSPVRLVHLVGLVCLVVNERNQIDQIDQMNQANASGDHAQFTTDRCEGGAGSLKLFARVGRRHLHTNPCLTFRHNRVTEPPDIDPFL